MGTVNRKKEAVKPEVHANHMGGESYDIKNAVNNLRVIAASCFFGEPQYYHDGAVAKKTAPSTYGGYSLVPRATLDSTLGGLLPPAYHNLNSQQLVEKAIDDALDQNPEATLEIACQLRKEDHIRTTPQVILVRAAHHPRVRGTNLIGRFAPMIVQRADEPAVGLAYQLATYGKDAPIPNSLKRAWKNRLESYNDYALAKYRLDDREVKTVDVVNLVHAKSSSVNKLMKGSLKNTNSTWEAIISKEGSNPDAWEKAFGVMGHMALLRNLRNLVEKSTIPARDIVNKLLDGVEDGQQLPFRYYSAYVAAKQSGKASSILLDGIEKALKISLKNVPDFGGRMMCLADNSGSAQGATTSSLGTMKVSTIANLTGIIAGMKADDGYLGVFGDKLDVMQVRAGSSVFDQLEKAEKSAQTIGEGTENGIWLFWKKAIEEKQHWDNVFVFSDMQAGHGGLYGVNPGSYKEYAIGNNIDVASLVKKYRNTVNPKVNVYLVQVAGYRDTIVPEFYKRTYILGGWGEGLLKFAAKVSGLMDQLKQ
jgi:hypothetical protein